MGVPLSSVHIYLNATIDAKDGVVVSETLAGEPKILMSAFRNGISKVIQAGIRADNLTCYLVIIRIVGENSNKVYLSYDGLVWDSYLFFNKIGLVNNLFFIKMEVGSDEDFGDDVSTSLLIDCFSPVNKV